MRLLHKTTKQLEWFTDDKIPPYIILSHRWHDQETSLQDFQEQKDKPAEQWSKGVEKLMKVCDLVQDHAEDYVWIDTCCIDKQSSTELQEAINSMYLWYEQAEKCLVQLDDVYDVDTADKEKMFKQMEPSKWFTRGWTLQELLAPKHAIFYDADWHKISTRKKCQDVISKITGINVACFGNRQAILATTVAERMSWLSTRVTTRVEDLAYCMLGIFDVNMTMLYGEGSKAFVRLQKEIIQEIDDETVFLSLASASEQPSILAHHPRDFTACRGLDIKIDHFFRRDYSVTKRGAQFEVCGTRDEQFFNTNELLLNCLIDGRRAVLPVKTEDSRSENRRIWHREGADQYKTIDKKQYPRPKANFSIHTDAKRDIMRKFGRPSTQVSGGHEMFEYESEVIIFRMDVV